MGGAIFVPTQITQLRDAPQTLVGHAGKILTVKSDELGFELTTNPFTDAGSSVYATNNAAFRIFDSGTLPTLRIWQTVANPPMAIAGAHVYTRKTSGANILNNFRSHYYIDDTSMSTYEVATANIVECDAMSGAVGAGIFAGWDLNVGPTTSPANRGIVGREINVQEREGDNGLVTSQSGKWSAILQLVPEGLFGATAYNVSFGLAFWQKLGGGNPRTHIPIFIAERAIATDGYGFYIKGGTSAADDPSYAGRFAGHFDKGIDFSGATLNSTNKEALILADLHSIVLGSCRIYADGNDLWFYDPNTGAKKLSTM